MGYSKVQKEKTHKRIVAIASKRFREKGLAGFGIAELMKEAGLTDWPGVPALASEVASGVGSNRPRLIGLRSALRNGDRVT